MARPVSAAARSKSVCRQRKAGICSKSMNSPAISASAGECTSVVTGIFSSRPMEARIWHPAREFFRFDHARPEDKCRLAPADGDVSDAQLVHIEMRDCSGGL